MSILSNDSIDKFNFVASDLGILPVLKAFSRASISSREVAFAMPVLIASFKAGVILWSTSAPCPGTNVFAGSSFSSSTSSASFFLITPNFSKASTRSYN